MPYELPEIVHPETVKFCIEIPNERFYLEAFWGALWDLAKAYNHADDDEHTALEVATVWRDLWFVNHDGFMEGTNMCSGCCSAETNLLLQIYNQNNLYMSFVLNLMDDGENPQSFAPDAPENYDTNTGDEFPDARIRALCAAVSRYVHNVISNVLQANRDADAVADVIEVFPPFGIILGLVDVLVDIGVDALVALANDTDAIDDVICHMLGNLTGQPVTQAVFRDSVDAGAFTALSNQWQIAVIVDIANASVANWRAFTGILGDSYEQAAGGGQVDCPCDCDDDIILEDYAGTGTVITPMGDCIYKFYQATPIFEGGSDRYYHSFRDTNGQCLLVENSDNPSYPTQGMSDHWTIDCNGVPSETVGGISGGELVQARWRQSLDTNYLKITLGTA